MARYTFGDDERAVRRLRLVAEAYRPTSRAFLAESARRGVDVALDLGCGPGFSTQLLGETCRPADLIGIDASTDFTLVAEETAPEARFEVLDLADPAVRLPPADVIYCRLLLAHLPDPLEAVGRWQQALTDGGVLLIEDLDHVVAPDGPLREYEDLSSRTVRSGGGVMYGGKVLEPLGGRLTAVTVPAPLASEIYLLNVQRWLTGPETGAQHGRMVSLASSLEAMRQAGAPGDVSWVVRQVVLGGRA